MRIYIVCLLSLKCARTARCARATVRDAEIAGSFVQLFRKETRFPLEIKQISLSTGSQEHSPRYNRRVLLAEISCTLLNGSSIMNTAPRSELIAVIRAVCTRIAWNLLISTPRKCKRCRFRDEISLAPVEDQRDPRQSR